jgi:hypothetical protein
MATTEQRPRLSTRRAVCFCSRRLRVPRAAAPPNPSIERTPYGMLRMPPVAAHVER